jgi:O-antigen/teichoic acid export membrane protein
MILGVEQTPRSSMGRDVASAYFASVSRILSWVIVSAIVFRRFGADAFALLALIRATIGLLNYATLGLSPAMVRLAAVARNARWSTRIPKDRILPYESKLTRDPLSEVWSNGQIFSLITACIGVVVVIVYASLFEKVARVPASLEQDAIVVAAFMGAGTIARLLCDAPSAILQTAGEIAFDNILSGLTEWAWVILMFPPVRADASIVAVAAAYMHAALFFLAVRWYYAGKIGGGFLPRWKLINRASLAALSSFGFFVVAAQLADYLYAPIDYILINRLIGPETVAIYAPAIQLDAGLFLLVSGVSSVLLPRSALAHASGDIGTVRVYYVRGTILSLLLLSVASVAVWLISTTLFRLWLGNPMIATTAILPLVLIHTTIGGSSAVGRSILLAIGKVRAFTAAALVAGAVNVLLSWFFVAKLGLGLRGIVYGTIIAVVGRCAVWMPWYTMRCLKRAASEKVQRVLGS